MPLIRYKVTLTKQERAMLQEIATRGKHSSQKMLNALILLGCDAGRFQERRLTAEQIVGVLPVSMRKVDRVKRRFLGRNVCADYESRATPNVGLTHEILDHAIDPDAKSEVLADDRPVLFHVAEVIGELRQAEAAFL